MDSCGLYRGISALYCTVDAGNPPAPEVFRNSPKLHKISSINGNICVAFLPLSACINTRTSVAFEFRASRFRPPPRRRCLCWKA